jgi:heme oxygenase (biliverdin-IX-beta and delta-forming)
VTSTGFYVDGVLRRLKHETSDLHHEAERHVRILDDDATEATYVRYLGRMLGFHGPMEDAFALHGALVAAGFEPESRRKSHLLRADLAALAFDAALVPACRDLPEIESLARAVGAAYVIEGSTLGGSFIIARMRARLGHLVGLASAFLEGYREATGPRWRQFATVVEAAITDDHAADAAVDAARATFTALTSWLDEPALDPPHPFRAAVRERRAVLRS